MRYLPIIVFLMLIFSLSASSQKTNWLRFKMRNADTILLVSHQATAGIGLVDSLGKRIPLPKLLVNGRPNDAIIMESKIVSRNQLDTLINILARPFTDRTIVKGKCFIPHHAVFILKNGKASYIDICFGCRDFATSKDLIQLELFDDRKWSELHEYFVKLGFKYELVDE